MPLFRFAAAAPVLLGAMLSGCAPRLAGTAAAPASPSTVTPSPAAALEAALPSLLEEGEVPGAALALVEDGRVAWTRGFGVKHAATGEPVTPGTVFEAASLSKPVFAYAVLKLVDQGRLDLDAPLSRYLPEPYVAGDERLHRITARTVLSHTTGLPNWRRGNQPLRIGMEPGARFSYSGEGYVYLQKAVEHLTGEPLDALVRRLVLEPLGMTSSSFVWQERYDTLKAHAHDASGRVAGRNRAVLANAASSLETTAGDYGRFLAAVLRGEGLRLETAREMLRPQVAVEEACTQCVGQPEGARSEAISWGLGWGLQRVEGDTALWHWGDNGNMQAYVAALRGSGRGVVLLTNGANGLSVAPEIVRIALGADQPSFAWLGYERYDARVRRLLREVLAGGVAAASGYRARWQAGDADPLTEAEVNRLGYALLGRGRVPEAVEVLRWNVEDHPGSANVHDSMGEAYARAGDRQRAARHYRRALELDPQNAGAAEMLRRLEAPVVAVAAEVLAAYTGEYELPLGRLTVALREGRLFARLDEEPGVYLVPVSETRFWAEGARPEIEFVRGGDGRAAEVVLRVAGQEFRGRRER
ncbi:MAG TPA: serine hydrolase [Longimicrobiaceae bacterium]|nr:serine hydrolase [Longimicrobiaceae bacterium]